MKSTSAEENHQTADWVSKGACVVPSVVGGLRHYGNGARQQVEFSQVMQVALQVEFSQAMPSASRWPVPVRTLDAAFA